MLSFFYIFFFFLWLLLFIFTGRRGSVAGWDKTRRNPFHRRCKYWSLDRHRGIHYNNNVPLYRSIRCAVDLCEFITDDRPPRSGWTPVNIFFLSFDRRPRFLIISSLARGPGNGARRSCNKFTDFRFSAYRISVAIMVSPACVWFFFFHAVPFKDAGFLVRHFPKHFFDILDSFSLKLKKKIIITYWQLLTRAYSTFMLICGSPTRIRGVCLKYNEHF